MLKNAAIAEAVLGHALFLRLSCRKPVWQWTTANALTVVPALKFALLGQWRA